MSGAQALTTLQLYRHILRAARQFPSVKRERIINEIKTDFRAKKGLTDDAQVQKARVIAERGLSDMQGYIAAAKQQSGDIHLKGATG